jgi:hypothetical protein
MSEEVKEVKKSKAEELAELEIAIKRAQLEELELSKQEKQYSLRDLKHRLSERDIREKQLTEDREAQGRTIKQDEQTDNYRWKICTHKKGGIVHSRDMRVLSTGGTGQQYAVIKHQMINGDIWVRCLRCGKTWTPPVEERFFFDKNGKEVPKRFGTFNQERFEKAVFEYQRAVQFETNNTMSGSVQCRFTKIDPETGKPVDAAQDVRESLQFTNLR